MKERRARRTGMNMTMTGSRGLTNGHSFKPKGMINGNAKGMINGSGHINGCMRETGMINGSGRINGCINGNHKGRINGCINGNHNHPKGLINGNAHRPPTGLVNGTGHRNGGLVNGGGSKISGYVNGYRSKSNEDYIVEVKDSHYYRHKHRQRKLYETFSVLVVIGVLAVIPFASTYTIHTMERITIDGCFDDWKKSGAKFLFGSKYVSDSNSNPNIRISNYATDYSASKLSIYLKTQGTIMKGIDNNMDKVNVFIDMDNNTNTGYLIRGIGAELMVEVNGCNNTVGESAISTYVGNEQTNWLWEYVKGVPCAIDNNQMELSFNTKLFGRMETSARFVITANDANYNLAISNPFDMAGELTSQTKYVTGSGDIDIKSPISIDGEFSDWNNVDGSRYQKQDRIGITGQKKVIGTNSTSIYISTKGELFMGNNPSQIRQVRTYSAQPSTGKGNETQGGSTSVSIKEKIARQGNDTLTIDFDKKNRIIVQGIYSRIYKSELQSLYGKEWCKVKDIKSAVNLTEFELQALDCPISPNITVTITDYRGHIDKIFDTMKWSKNGNGNYIDVVVDTTTDMNATRYVQHRNCFRDTNGYYWICYDYNTDPSIERSDDTSATAWTGSRTTLTSNPACHTIWYNDASTAWFVYCISFDLKIKKGTLSGNPTTLSLGGESTALDGDTNARYVIGWVSLDSSGYIWCGARYWDGANYKFRVIRSQNAGDETSWGSVSTLSSDTASTLTYGIILPLASRDMYAIWRLDGALEGKRYTHSNTTWWTGKDSLGTLPNTAGRDFSAVVDSSYNIHLTYIESNGKLAYKKRTGTTWGSENIIDTNTDVYYPSISLNTQDNSLGIFYGRTTTLYAMYSASGSKWTTPTSLAAGVTDLRYINSAYHSSGSLGQCIVIYMSGSSSPYDVNSLIQNLPDMPELIKIMTPIFIPMAIIVYVGLNKKRKKQISA